MRNIRTQYDGRKKLWRRLIHDGLRGHRDTRSLTDLFTVVRFHTMTDIINFSGSVWGTTTRGTVFMEMLRTGSHIEGRLCVMETGLGQLNALFVGEWSAENRI